MVEPVRDHHEEGSEKNAVRGPSLAGAEQSLDAISSADSAEVLTGSALESASEAVVSVDGRALAELKATKDVLELFARGANRRQYLHSLLDLICAWSSCEYLGVRLIDRRRHIPYEASSGFDESFLEKEHDLSLETDQCVCTRVILAAPDSQDLPWVTEGGSFVTNDSQSLVASLSPEQLQRFRGVCVKSGFLSIAVIPIRYRGQILGALHLADRKPNAFPKDVIEFIESLVPLIGEAVHRFGVEDLLREKEALFRAVLDQTLQLVALLNLDGTVRDANQTSLTFFGESRKSSWLALPFWDLSGWGRCIDKTWVREAVAQAGRGQLVRNQMEVVGADGAPATIDFSLKPVKDAAGQILCLIAEGRDISESKQLERRILEITSQEQHQIGNDLYDVLGQDLVGISMLSKILEKQLKERSLPEAEDAQRIAELARRAAGEARGLAMDLCMAGHNRDDLAAALRTLAVAIEEQHGIACTVDGAAGVEVRNPAITTQLFRIVQEAVDNAVRHGKASHVTITLVSRQDGFDLIVRDNRTNSPDDPGSYQGADIMRYRASMIGGTLDIRRDPAGGMLVTFASIRGSHGCPCGSRKL